MATVKLDPAKGIQIPNLTTTERNAISSPETGAIIWNTTTSEINQYNGSAWEITYTDTSVAGITSAADATAITINSSEQVGIGTTPISTLSLGQTGGGNGNQLFFTYNGGSTDRSYSIGTNAYAWGELDIQASDSNDTTIDRRILNVSRDGDVKINTGDLIFGTANKGIVLGATTNVDANTLDDYETGTWTPVMNGTSGGSTQAVYVKVGRMVTCHMMNWGFTATAVDATVSGLPFTSNGAYITGVVSACDWVTNAASVWGYSNSNLYVRDCVNRNEGTGRAGSPRYFSMSITYRTT